MSGPDTTAAPLAPIAGPDDEPVERDPLDDTQPLVADDDDTELPCPLDPDKCVDVVTGGAHRGELPEGRLT